MKKEVIVLDANQTLSQNICNMLEVHSYKTASLNSLADLNGYMAESQCQAVILNLDNMPVTNKTLKELKSKNPLTSIITVSKRQFHPELAESLREYISVCLTDPVDPDEVNFQLLALETDDPIPAAADQLARRGLQLNERGRMLTDATATRAAIAGGATSTGCPAWPCTAGRSPSLSGKVPCTSQPPSPPIW